MRQWLLAVALAAVLAAIAIVLSSERAFDPAARSSPAPVSSATP